MTGIACSDFEIAAWQLVMFTPDGGIDSGALVRRFIPAVGAEFDGEPVLLPAGQLPPEVPRAILQSADGAWRCEVAHQAVRVKWSMRPARPTTSEQVVGLSRSVLERYRESLHARVGRLAVVVTRFARHELPGVFLATHFCEKRWLEAPLNRPEGFELHAHKRYHFPSGVEVNSWVRNKAGSVRDPSGEAKAVLVEQDLNSLSEESDQGKAFSAADTSAFFDEAHGELDGILRLYYPEEDA